jgi:hypothetical protein
MLRTLLICGMLAGVCGGLLATGFASVVGEPAVDRAIAFEDAKAQAAHEPAEPELVSRDIQRSLGLVSAAGIYGLAVGGVFALAFGFAYGRVGRASPARTALWLAAGTFVVLFLVPFLKYPANPPSIGDPDTIERRTLLYLTMIAISGLAALAALRLRTLLAARRAPGTATLAAGAAYLAIVVAAGLALPGIHEVPADFPAVTLWRFREASIGMQAVMWTTVGLVFAALAPRVLAGEPLWPWRRGRARGAVATAHRE